MTAQINLRKAPTVAAMIQYIAKRNSAGEYPTKAEVARLGRPSVSTSARVGRNQRLGDMLRQGLLEDTGAGRVGTFALAVTSEGRRLAAEAGIDLA